MDSYSEKLKQIMSYIVSNTPPEQLYAEYSELKQNITKTIDDLRKMSSLLDAIAEQYNIKPNVVQQKTVSIRPRDFVSIENDKEQILQIALKTERDGIINTKTIVPQLRTLGDTRSDSAIMIAVGNILHNNGWRKVDTGKYTKVVTSPQMEVK